MPQPLHTVAETPEFLRKAREAGVGDDERAAIVNAIAANPKAGDPVRGSGGVFKQRFAGRGKGKSGGYRAMVAYLGPDAPAYVLSLLSKGERDNFSAAEIAAMHDLVKDLKRYWRDAALKARTESKE